MQGERPSIAGAETVLKPFPIQLKGKVVKGFGRGSKDLGIPTANFEEDTTHEAAIKELERGIYFGWAQVAGVDPEIYPMVMSCGYNPYYHNEKLSAEVHVIHRFDQDFYGEQLHVVVLGYIRAEKDYESKKALIEDIHTDIKVAEKSLQRQDYFLQKKYLALTK